MHPPRSIYARPPARLPDIETLKLSYYHVTDLPEGITTPGSWDLRGGVDDYLGRFDIAGKRVLEIGPASGFLTMEMERRGADIVALDIPEDGNWDFVPFPDDVMAGIREHRFNDMRYIRNTWWYTHRAFGLRAKAVYADVYNIPRELGRFDIALLAAVLLHTASPHKIVAECAQIADTIIVTELLHRELDSCGPILRFHPTAANQTWDMWWDLTPSFVATLLSVLGFTRQSVTYHQQHHVLSGADRDYFTVVASR
jgi:O-methyltransferase